MGCGIVLLAAGASSRMGRPKQLLMYQGKTLLDHSITSAKKSRAKKIVLVIGANEDAIIKSVTSHGITIVKNEYWEQGMSSSIKAGLQNLLTEDPAIESVIFMACDQPFVTAVLLNKLIDTHEQIQKPIVASSYGNSAGIPALFDKTIFASLMTLTGDKGAKKIISQHPDLVHTIEFAEGNSDIDTISDYEQLLKQTTGEIIKFDKRG
ncbi:hypothetical protein BH11BAC3_BH11BAC3_21810 [soil metagenome]